MEEIYQEIENRIRACGYLGAVDGFDIYEELSDQIEDKEEGSYLLLSKKSDSVYFEYKVEIMKEEFNLSYIDIHDGEQCYHIDFDDKEIDSTK